MPPRTEKTLEIKITWQNGSHFKCRAKVQDGTPSDWKTVVEAEENGHIGVVWSALQSAVMAFTAAQLNAIGDEMKL